MGNGEMKATGIEATHKANQGDLKDIREDLEEVLRLLTTRTFLSIDALNAIAARTSQANNRAQRLLGRVGG